MTHRRRLAKLLRSIRGLGTLGAGAAIVIALLAYHAWLGDRLS